jgi:hypothetical protein
VKQLLILLVLVVGCATGPRSPTIRGADLYAHANEIRQTGSARVPSSHGTVVVRGDQYLVDRSLEQVFVVRDVVAGCYGEAFDADCTLALMRGQRFVVSDRAPTPRGENPEAGDISGLNKARLVLAAATAAMIVGAAKCDAFDGCGALLGAGAAVPGFLLLLSYTGLK